MEGAGTSATSPATVRGPWAGRLIKAFDERAGSSELEWGHPTSDCRGFLG